jgi:hypothetical protein
MASPRWRRIAARTYTTMESIARLKLQSNRIRDDVLSQHGVGSSRAFKATVGIVVIVAVGGVAQNLFMFNAYVALIFLALVGLAAGEGVASAGGVVAMYRAACFPAVPASYWLSSSNHQSVEDRPFAQPATGARETALAQSGATSAAERPPETRHSQAAVDEQAVAVDQAAAVRHGAVGATRGAGAAQVSMPIDGGVHGGPRADSRTLLSAAVAPQSNGHTTDIHPRAGAAAPWAKGASAAGIAGGGAATHDVPEQNTRCAADAVRTAPYSRASVRRDASAIVRRLLRKRSRQERIAAFERRMEELTARCGGRSEHARIKALTPAFAHASLLPGVVLVPTASHTTPSSRTGTCRTTSSRVGTYRGRTASDLASDLLAWGANQCPATSRTGTYRLRSAGEWFAWGSNQYPYAGHLLRHLLLEPSRSRQPLLFESSRQSDERADRDVEGGSAC